MTAEGELQAIVTSVDASEEQSDSENPGACGKVKRQQMDHVAEEGYVGSCHYGQVHEPVSIKEAMKIPAAKAVVDKNMEWIGHNSSLTSSVRRRRMENNSLRDLMDLCHLKNAKLAKHLQKYKRRVVLQGRKRQRRRKIQSCIHRARSSASQMAAAKILDTISKLLDTAGETSDAISACTQVKMTEAPRLLRMPSKECPEHVDHNFPQQRPEGWDEIDGAVVLFDMNLYGHPLACLLWERNLKKCHLKRWWGKRTNIGMSFRAHDARIVLIGICGWCQNVGTRQNMEFYVQNLAKRNQPWRSNAILRSSVFGLHAKRCKCWSVSGTVQSWAFQKGNDDQGSWGKRSN